MRFSFDDFNIEFKKELEAIIIDQNIKPEVDYKHLGIKLKLFIHYDETDNLSNVGLVMMDLDPLNNVIVLGYEYILTFQNYLQLRKEYSEFILHENAKNNDNPAYIIKTIYHFLQVNHSKFFKLSKKSFEYDRTAEKVNDNNFISLINEDKDIINFKYISAKRDVSNKEVDTTLSNQTSRIYNRTEVNDEQNKFVEQFKDRLSETDSHLSEIYKSLFASIIKKVKAFGGIRINESEIDIISTLQHRELLEGNTTVVYKHDSDNLLPEHYNGLGYLNLISIIFEIEILVNDFKGEKNKKPADINLLFIEEPEAHTHPQMQYVFIKNIKQLLKEEIKLNETKNINLQYIISTHSAHIVADSDFDDIKYLKKESNNSVVAKNLKDMKKEYDVNTTQYQFLKQYLTLSRAEIFFAEKAILIEGDTERILIPTLMKKIDIEEEKKYALLGEKDNSLPMLSQNISIIEVGAYSQIFERFIAFIGIKTLIITDLDAINTDGEKCEVASGVDYSNEAIRSFYGDPLLDELKNFAFNEKLFIKVNDIWIKSVDGNLCVVYQTAENGYNARSFEDAFININRDFIIVNMDSFKGLKNKNNFNDVNNTAYILASDCIKKKTHFSLDILFNSNGDFSNWEIPAYIKEGLLWLKKD